MEDGSGNDVAKEEGKRRWDIDKQEEICYRIIKIN
jgi:hypothetical protein